MTALRLTLVLLLAFFASFSSLKGQTQADATTGLNGLAGMPLQLTLEVGLLVVMLLLQGWRLLQMQKAI